MSESPPSIGGPASSVYWARVVKTPSDWRDWAFGGALVGLEVAVSECPVDVPGERYRVLVGRRGTDTGIGVAMAYWRRHARRSLRAVESDLADLSPEEFSAKYRLDDENR